VTVFVSVARLPRMQGGDPLPDHVLRFLVDRIESVPHLEALLLLWQSPERGWSLEEIATRVYVSPDAAAKLLLDLARHGMVKNEAAAWRYATDWEEGKRLMPDVASTYARQLVRVAQLIHSKASLGVREFARAFQLKKDRN
jgi:DNA-binding IclR family transcriptional regulator